MEGWVTLTALLDETSRLLGGVPVSGMVYRHPDVLANMASTLDITSGGRLELAIGAGWNEEECDAFGIELGSMRERFDRFEEGLEVLESLLNNERTTFRGDYYVITDAMNDPKPVQRPLPICIGGRGEQRTIPLAARYATHWNFGGQDMAEFAECRAVLHESCAAIGRDPAEITRSARTSYTSDDELRTAVAEMATTGVDLVIVGIPKAEPPTVIETVARALA
jgi:alkanesulfonate monooxygenase SsuD/methylene tetrahydromethanopterin reductase-like flavin-dependent oxidoreductase (luciferase family)